MREERIGGGLPDLFAERIGFIGKRNVDKRKRLHFRGAGLFEGRFFEMGT